MSKVMRRGVLTAVVACVLLVLGAVPSGAAKATTKASPTAPTTLTVGDVYWTEAAVAYAPSVGRYGALVIKNSSLALAQFRPDGTGLFVGPAVPGLEPEQQELTWDGEQFVAVVRWGGLLALRFDPATGALTSRTPITITSSGSTGSTIASLRAGKTLVARAAWTGSVAGVWQVQLKLLDRGSAPPVWVDLSESVVDAYSHHVGVAAGNGRYLVVWPQLDFVMGTFVSADGVPGAPFVIAQDGGDGGTVAASWDPSAQSYVVAWADLADANALKIRAVRLAPDGTALDATPIDISKGAPAGSEVKLDSDGVSTVVSWMHSAENGPSSVWMNRITNGAVTTAATLIGSGSAFDVTAGPTGKSVVAYAGCCNGGYALLKARFVG